MPTVRKERPRDRVQLAKLVGDIATGQVEDCVPETPKTVRAQS